MVEQWQAGRDEAPSFSLSSHVLGNQRVRRASPRGLVNSVDLVDSDCLGNQCDGWASLRSLVKLVDLVNSRWLGNQLDRWVNPQGLANSIGIR